MEVSALKAIRVPIQPFVTIHEDTSSGFGRVHVNCYSMKETELVKSCLEWLQWKGIFAWRVNNVGIYNKKSGGYFFHGLAGVSDILGILPVKVEDGKPVGALLAVECKVGKNEPTEDQHHFLQTINEKGGIGVWVTSLEELQEDLRSLGV